MSVVILLRSWVFVVEDDEDEGDDAVGRVHDKARDIKLECNISYRSRTDLVFQNVLEAIFDVHSDMTEIWNLLAAASIAASCPQNTFVHAKPSQLQTPPCRAAE